MAKKKRFKFVLDTNWYVSASINRNSKRRLYDLLINQNLMKHYSRKLIAEYESVISRKKFEKFIRQEQVSRFISFVLTRLKPVMKTNNKFIIIFVAVVVLFTSCNTLDKAAVHGFGSGYYKLESRQIKAQKVYVDITDENIDVYQHTKDQPVRDLLLTFPLKHSDSLMFGPMVFKKQSLDIDITSILFKYRPSVDGLQEQLTTDFNVALYAGWRYDKYYIKRRMDPLGRSYPKITNLGYDFGFFAGPGVTPINPFTTRNKRTDEYSGMIVQTGIAGFIESNVASFGIAVGFDYLLNPDREVWIYSNKPWAGFIVGIAIN